MIKKLTSYLDYSIFAELSLLMFGAIFIAIVVRTLMMRGDQMHQQSEIVLGDEQENQS